MKKRSISPLYCLFCGLVGFNLGFATALLLAQWTWLELRVNTGLLIIFGTLAGLVFSVLKDVRRPIYVGGFSVIALLITSFGVAKGSFESMQIMMGVMFREGILLPDLPLQVASGVAIGIGLLAIAVAWLYNQASCSACQTCKVQKA